MDIDETNLVIDLQERRRFKQLTNCFNDMFGEDSDDDSNVDIAAPRHQPFEDIYDHLNFEQMAEQDTINLTGNDPQPNFFVPEPVTPIETIEMYHFPSNDPYRKLHLYNHIPEVWFRKYKELNLHQRQPMETIPIWRLRQHIARPDQHINFTRNNRGEASGPGPNGPPFYRTPRIKPDNYFYYSACYYNRHSKKWEVKTRRTRARHSNRNNSPRFRRSRSLDNHRSSTQTSRRARARSSHGMRRPVNMDFKPQNRRWCSLYPILHPKLNPVRRSRESRHQQERDAVRRRCDNDSCLLLDNPQQQEDVEQPGRCQFPDCPFGSVDQRLEQRQNQSQDVEQSKRQLPDSPFDFEGQSLERQNQLDRAHLRQLLEENRPAFFNPGTRREFEHPIDPRLRDLQERYSAFLAGARNNFQQEHSNLQEPNLQDQGFNPYNESTTFYGSVHEINEDDDDQRYQPPPFFNCFYCPNNMNTVQDVPFAQEQYAHFNQGLDQNATQIIHNFPLFYNAVPLNRSDDSIPLFDPHGYCPFINSNAQNERTQRPVSELRPLSVIVPLEEAEPRIRTPNLLTLFNGEYPYFYIRRNQNLPCQHDGSLPPSGQNRPNPFYSFLNPIGEERSQFTCPLSSPLCFPPLQPENQNQNQESFQPTSAAQTVFPPLSHGPSNVPMRHEPCPYGICYPICFHEPNWSRYIDRIIYDINHMTVEELALYTNIRSRPSYADVVRGQPGQPGNPGQPGQPG